MIPLLLMLAVADAPAKTPVDAERAFAADAKTIGQWTAFRKWSTDDATMFVPQPNNAHDFLKDRKDPPKAIDWWPTESYLSCDGTLAVNTGGWQRPDGSVGYFSTVWQRQPDGSWRWIVDGGDALTKSRPKPVKAKIVRAKCAGILDDSAFIVRSGAKGDRGYSKDNTLSWSYVVEADGSREFVVTILTGEAPRLLRVIDDKIAAPAK
jgi:hypothetical protein